MIVYYEVHYDKNFIKSLVDFRIVVETDKLEFLDNINYQERGFYHETIRTTDGFKFNWYIDMERCDIPFSDDTKQYIQRNLRILKIERLL